MRSHDREMPEQLRNRLKCGLLSKDRLFKGGDLHCSTASAPKSSSPASYAPEKSMCGKTNDWSLELTSSLDLLQTALKVPSSGRSSQDRGKHFVGLEWEPNKQASCSETFQPSHSGGEVTTSPTPGSSGSRDLTCGGSKPGGTFLGHLEFKNDVGLSQLNLGGPG